MNETSLDATLAQYESLGRLCEDASLIDGRLHAAVEAAAESKELHPGEMGLADWASKTVKSLKSAVHDRICDSKQGKVNVEFKELLDKGTSKEAITAIGTVVTSVCVALGLGPLAVSSVVLYLAIWIVKIGLNSWCSLPADKQS
jgi:hypothetical protein